MSRNHSRAGASFSPTQRKACIVLICCILAVVITFIASWILPAKLGTVFGKDSYDPELYPLDTSLGAVLQQSAEAGNDYITSAVFVGDQYTVSLQSSNQVTLNQYVGQSGLKISDFMGTACVNFVDDASSYTIPQALAKMKPRRVIVTLGSNDTDGSVSADLFSQDYRQALNAISAAYPYCDIIVNAIPPVLRSSENSAERQLIADQFNQRLALLCDEMGYKFLNSTEMLKNDTGYAEKAYFDESSNVFTASGVNTLLSYARTHAWETSDQRPDTSDIPQRAAQPASSAVVTPSPTPLKHKVSYGVEEGRGTLTGNGSTGVSSLEFEVDDRSTVSVTAVASTGYTFYKWSDGQTSETRYDIVTDDFSVTAMFNDARVELTLDRGDTTMKKGESISVNATVKLGGKSHDNSGVQWSVNGELQQNGKTFTFTPSAAGEYVIKAGIEINGTFKSAQFKVTVADDPTTISVSGPSSMELGGSTTLTASVQNAKGDTTWTCDQIPGWGWTGNQAQFTPSAAGTYTLRAKNNGVEATFNLAVNPAATPAPTPEPTEAPQEPSGEASE